MAAFTAFCKAPENKMPYMRNTGPGYGTQNVNGA